MSIKSFWNIVARYFSNIKEVLPFLKSDEQIRLSWLTRIKTLEDVPEVYRTAFAEIVGTSEFPYTLITPSYAGFNIKGSEKLVFCLEDRVYELAASPGSLESKYHLFTNVQYIEIGRALLHSWVKICSTAESGEPLITEYVFNTISENIFSPIVNQIRLAFKTSRQVPLETEQGRFDVLYQENMKLMNYTRRSILPEEKLVHIVLQPEIQKESIKLFGRPFFRIVSLPHISILTDQELILIQEGTGERGSDDVNYGGIYQYIPLEQIASLETYIPKENILTLSVRLSNGVCLDSDFSVAKRPEVDSFKKEIEVIL